MCSSMELFLHSSITHRVNHPSLSFSLVISLIFCLGTTGLAFLYHFDF